MANNDADGDLEHWKEQLKIANSVLKKQNYPLPTAEQLKARKNRLNFCRQKIAELEG